MKSNLRDEFEVQAVLRMVNRLVELRDPGDHDGMREGSSADVVPVASELYGNLGNLVFLSGGKAYGEAWIASSLRSKYDLADYFEGLGISPVELSATECGTLFFESLEDPNMAHVFKPLYATKQAKSHDSEYLLINFLAKSLLEMRIHEGKLYLLTERIPCKHCTSVIRRFKLQFPRVNVNVMYLLNTRVSKGRGVVKVRTAKDFCVETAGSGINLLHATYGSGVLTTRLRTQQA